MSPKRLFMRLLAAAALSVYVFVSMLFSVNVGFSVSISLCAIFSACYFQGMVFSVDVGFNVCHGQWIQTGPQIPSFKTQVLVCILFPLHSPRLQVYEALEHNGHASADLISMW